MDSNKILRNFNEFLLFVFGNVRDIRNAEV